MKKLWVKPTVVLGALVALMMLAGLLFVNVGGVAQAQTASPTPPASGTPSTGTPPSGTPPQRGPGNHGGPGGKGDPGDHAGPGAAATLASATSELASTSQKITTAKTDLAYAKGKMDTAQVEALIAKADGLYTQADTALKASEFAKASTYARAAKDVVSAATDLMSSALGTALPSAANRPARPTAPTAATETDGGKARVSRELSRTYQELVNAATEAKANSSSDVSFYLTTSQQFYKQAYDLYNAGKFDQASQVVRPIKNLLHAADSLLHLNEQPNQPVTVPAPTF